MKDIAFFLLDIQELVSFVFQLSFFLVVSSHDKGIGNFNEQWAKTSHCFQTVLSRQLSRVVITRAYLATRKNTRKRQETIGIHLHGRCRPRSYPVPEATRKPARRQTSDGLQPSYGLAKMSSLVLPSSVIDSVSSWRQGSSEAELPPSASSCPGRSSPCARFKKSV